MFQFTHPGRGATWRRALPSRRVRRFNSRTPGGVRQMPTGGKLEFRTVSIHAPREGCDTDYHMSVDQRVKFQFTHPGRGATFLMEDIKQGKEFQFTHPGRGATVYSGADGREMRVSIHAPREGCDPRPSSCPCRRRSFNSRTPGGVRRRTQNIRN